MSHDLWSIILVIGVALWIASCITFMFKAFPQRGVFDSKAGLRWGVAITVSFVIWIVGLLNA
ncbi:MAG: hypothetical protein WC007_03585 [Pelobacteraceae bacterium]